MEIASISSIPIYNTMQIIIHFLFRMKCEHIQYATENIFALYVDNNTNSYNGNEIDIHLTIYFRMEKKIYFTNIKKQLTVVVLNTWTYMLKCSHRTQLT